jgi:hypothetical protein
VKQLVSVVAIVVFVLSWPLAGAASKGSGASKSGGAKTVHVKEHTSKNGTHVAAHDRKAPAQHHEPKAATSSAVARNERGRIQRSDAARHAFARQTGYPNGRPGYVIDHIRPLACGGADVPSNMQWQTIAAGKAKDRTERAGCR